MSETLTNAQQIVDATEQIKVGLASPETIMQWSNGEVTKPETINYRTLKPTPDGLFCEKIFGPTRDWECSCGKYKKLKYKNIICEKCGVEVTMSKARRNRMGHIQLAVPIVHSFYMHGQKSYLSYLLTDINTFEEVKPKLLTKVIYHSAYIVTSTDQMAIDSKFPGLETIVNETWEDYLQNCIVFRDRVQYLLLSYQQKASAFELGENANKNRTKLEATIKQLSNELKAIRKDVLKDVEIQAAVIEKQISQIEKKAAKLKEELPFDDAKEIADRKDALAALQSISEAADTLPEMETDPEDDLDALMEEQDTIREQLDRMRADTIAEERYLEELLLVKTRHIIEDYRLVQELKTRFGKFFTMGMGADAILKIIDNMDLPAELETLKEMLSPENIGSISESKKQKALKKMRVLNGLVEQSADGSAASSMMMTVLPVLPPDLRPMVQIDGGRFATSDLNDLYRRVINRNNRLKNLLELDGAPEVILQNERRMLQQAVDALFDNGRKTVPTTGQSGRPLKSLADALKGKQGRFRLNLLGKRVDYSARSVIVGGPSLKMHQCGLPRTMALELFKPFVINQLVQSGVCAYVKAAKRLVEKTIAETEHFETWLEREAVHDVDKQVQIKKANDVWEKLGEVIQENVVMLNRAPTLHRLGIQAFEPVLVSGKAIRLHPLVCSAFNADFDGDQMAVFVPLSSEAQAEAKTLMIASNNLLSPANGHSMVTPTQDMIMGSYYLSWCNIDDPRAGRVFRTREQLEAALETGQVSVHTPIEYRIPALKDSSNMMFNMTEEEQKTLAKVFKTKNSPYQPTTVGRALFNDLLPDQIGYLNCVLDRQAMSTLVERLSHGDRSFVPAEVLDDVKDICFSWGTKSGISLSVADVHTPTEKDSLLAEAEEVTDKINKNYERGIITESEQRQQEVEVWTQATNEIRAALEESMSGEPLNPVNMMVSSGARSNMMQIRQISGMRGLVANPRGDIIPRPIKSNFKEGLSMLEYYMSTPGARKGLVDTALRTSDSGYLTRRLVDVSQEVIINDLNPFDKEGKVPSLLIENVVPDTPAVKSYLDTRLLGRVLAEDVKLSNKETIEKGTLVTPDVMADLRDDKKVTSVRVLSPLTDESENGITAMSYGMSMSTGKLIEVGEAVGVIAAQSIGEPGTQLTMRTFHTGGVVGKDLAEGLPRVVELFEAHSPKGQAILAPISGIVNLTEAGESSDRIVAIASETDDGSYVEIPVSRAVSLLVSNGDVVVAGDKLVDGSIDLKELLSIKGLRATQKYLVEQVQKVYRDQGVSIHEKHIEIIVRQMTNKIMVIDPGDTHYLPEDVVPRSTFMKANQEIRDQNGKPASGKPFLMGITRAALSTPSWIAAASFQETSKVLTEAAVSAKVDNLTGLKENIVIGKLIPAGTGLERYHQVGLNFPDYVEPEGYADDTFMQIPDSEVITVGADHNEYPV